MADLVYTGSPTELKVSNILQDTIKDLFKNDITSIYTLYGKCGTHFSIKELSTITGGGASRVYLPV